MIDQARRPRIEKATRESVVQELRARFDEGLSTNATVRKQHANITSWHPIMPPDAVLAVRSTEDVVDAVKICARHRFPIIGFGAGTSLEAGVNAPHGGLCIDMSGMNKVLDIHEGDMDCTVQAGVTRKQLNTELRATGLFFPIDPGADATLGGMASTRASGTNAVRYGTMRENVLSITAVMPDGSIRKTRSRARKSSAGYDLTGLMVGSEGTLGVITELTVRLHGIPSEIAAATCAFDDLEAACNTVIATIQCGIPIARIELLDDVQVKACNLHSQLGLPEKPTLVVEFHGFEASVAEQVELFHEMAEDMGGENFQWATRPEDRSRLWNARHDVYWACLALRPGAKFLATDVCVPISRLADCMIETQKDIEETRLVAPIVGHVGDGNFHVSVMADTENTEEMERIAGFLTRLNERAIAMEGTCTGEHGIGMGKQRYLLKELGESVDTMLAIKRAIDPDNIMNPGKIFLDGPDGQGATR